jgi:hypothetical protein
MKREGPNTRSSKRIKGINSRKAAITAAFLFPLSGFVSLLLVAFRAASRTAVHLREYLLCCLEGVLAVVETADYHAVVYSGHAGAIPVVHLVLARFLSSSGYIV